MTNFPWQSHKPYTYYFLNKAYFKILIQGVPAINNQMVSHTISMCYNFFSGSG